jgi:hypothetical protein
MVSDRRRQLMERYQNAISAVLVAADHLSEEELDVRLDAKSMSARQLIHHLADAALQDGIRLRRVLAENTPVLVPWDEHHYAERLHYERPISASLEAFRANSLLNLDVLKYLTEDQWHRQGNQQKPWPLTVEGWLEDEVLHVQTCLMHILNAPTGGRVIPDSDHEQQGLLDRLRHLSQHPRHEERAIGEDNRP